MSIAITPDGYPATHPAVAELMKSGVLRPQMKARTSKYLNDLAGQDHRRVKQRIYPMPGFRNFRNATTAVSGIGLIQELWKSRFDIEKFPGGVKEQVPRTWEAVLAT